MMKKKSIQSTHSSDMRNLERKSQTSDWMQARQSKIKYCSGNMLSCFKMPLHHFLMDLFNVFFLSQGHIMTIIHNQFFSSFPLFLMRIHKSNLLCFPSLYFLVFHLLFVFHLLLEIYRTRLQIDGTWLEK